MSRPDFLVPTGRSELRLIIEGWAGPRKPDEKVEALYCGSCYRQLQYKGKVNVLPYIYASQPTPHHGFHCPRCKQDIHIEVESLELGVRYSYMMDKFPNLLSFQVPVGDGLGRLVEVDDGARRYTHVVEDNFAERRVYYEKKLQELQR